MISLPNVKGLVVLGKTVLQAHRPELLFGASITATLAAVGLAAKGGYEARGKVDEKEAEVGRPLDTKEKVSLTWLCYMPAAVTTVTALGSTTGLHIVHVKEKKALAQTALGVIEEIKESAKEFAEENGGPLTKDQQEKVLEKAGGKKGAVLVEGSDGEIEELYLVRDPVTGRDIWSNKTRINDAMVEVCNIINGQSHASLNDFYDEAKWGRLPDGNLVGWSGTLPEIAWHDENGQPITGVRDDGRPWRGFRFRPTPEKDYDD